MCARADDPTPSGVLQTEFCIPRQPPQMAKVRRVEADLTRGLVTVAWDEPSAEGFDCGTNVRTTRVTVYRGTTSDVINTTVCHVTHTHALFFAPFVSPQSSSHTCEVRRRCPRM